jgi:phosphopantothenoylcysteine decarboxylase/phosphopantothenate--cysteine ligase
MSLARRRILLGVSGGIAAYKACELCRRLRRAGAEVRVVMTEAAARFVAPATFQALSGQPVRSSLWDETAEAAMGHIELARWAERIVVAPATADLIARLAHGLADDLLTTLCLASDAPLVLAPAMNRHMWAHAATQANVERLCARGATLLGPAAGEQACGDVAPGRNVDPEGIAGTLVGGRGEGGLGGLG